MYIKLEISTPILPINKESIGSSIIVAKKTTVNKLYFDFFILRFDIGFKTYNPTYPKNQRWLKDFNFSNAVYNIGINYPF